MAVIGALGDIPFSVSSNQIKTFSNMQWSSSAQWATHNRHLKTALVEFTGNDTDKISFNMTLSVFLGVDPVGDIEKLREYQKSGIILRLILGRERIGRGKWVIQSLQKNLEHFDGNGDLISAQVSVTLLEYMER